MKFSKIALVSALLGFAFEASAAPVDYSTLLTAADFSTTTAAIVSIGGIMAVVYVAWKGVGMVIGALKR